MHGDLCKHLGIDSSTDHPDIYRDTERYNESLEPIDAVNSLPLVRLEPTTLTTSPSTTPDIYATNCATETSQKRMFRKGRH